jgi:hypothetical protein
MIRRHHHVPPMAAPTTPSAPAVAMFAFDPVSLGLAYGAVGAPHPHAECLVGDRQPPAPLGLFGRQAILDIDAIAEIAAEKLAVYEEWWLKIDYRLLTEKETSETLALELSILPRGCEHTLARYRSSALLATTGGALLLETYLTDLGLQFAEVADWERRGIAFSIAVLLTAGACAAAWRARKLHGWKEHAKNPGLWLVASLVTGLTVLRYGVLSSNAAWWEMTGATFVLAAAAAAACFVVGFVENRVHDAVEEHEQWEAHEEAEQKARAAAEVTAQIQEWKDALPAEVERARNEGCSQICARRDQVPVDAHTFWTIVQTTNPAAAFDIRPELDHQFELAQEHADRKQTWIDERAFELRARMRPDLIVKPQPPAPPAGTPSPVPA